MSKLTSAGCSLGNAKATPNGRRMQSCVVEEIKCYLSKQLIVYGITHLRAQPCCAKRADAESLLAVYRLRNHKCVERLASLGATSAGRDVSVVDANRSDVCAHVDDIHVSRNTRGSIAVPAVQQRLFALFTLGKKKQDAVYTKPKNILS